MGYDWAIYIGLVSKPDAVDTFEDLEEWCENLRQSCCHIRPPGTNMTLLSEIICRSFHGLGDLACGNLDSLKPAFERMSVLDMCKGVGFRVYHTHCDNTGLTMYWLRDGRMEMLKPHDYGSRRVVIGNILTFGLTVTEDVMWSIVPNNISYYFNPDKKDYYDDFEYDFLDAQPSGS